MTALGLSCSMWDLVPWPGIEPRPPALGVQSLSYWECRALATGPPGKSPHFGFDLYLFSLWLVILNIHVAVGHLYFFFGNVSKSFGHLKNVFVCLAALGLSCGVRELVPWAGMEPRPPALGVQILAPGLPGKTLPCTFSVHSIAGSWSHMAGSLNIHPFAHCIRVSPRGKLGDAASIRSIPFWTALSIASWFHLWPWSCATVCLVYLSCLSVLMKE